MFSGRVRRRPHLRGPRLVFAHSAFGDGSRRPRVIAVGWLASRYPSSERVLVLRSDIATTTQSPSPLTSHPFSTQKSSNFNWENSSIGNWGQSVNKQTANVAFQSEIAYQFLIYFVITWQYKFYLFLFIFQIFPEYVIFFIQFYWIYEMRIKLLLLLIFWYWSLKDNLSNCLSTL